MEWMNEWMNEWMMEPINQSTSQPSNQPTCYISSVGWQIADKQYKQRQVKIFQKMHKACRWDLIFNSNIITVWMSKYLVADCSQVLEQHDRNKGCSGLPTLKCFIELHLQILFSPHFLLFTILEQSSGSNNNFWQKQVMTWVKAAPYKCQSQTWSSSLGSRPFGRYHTTSQNRT